MKQDNWYDYPQKIYFWDKDVDYAMFVDENGINSNINNVFKRMINNESINEDDRYFTITGCIFTKNNFKKINERICKLKNKYWEDGMYFDSKNKKGKYVCFHSRDIRRHDGAFNDKLIKHNEFINDLTKLLEKIDCKVISVSIDLWQYLKMGNLSDVYEVAFDLLLERYMYVIDNNKNGIVMLEARGKKEDKKLLKHICEVIYNNERSGMISNKLKLKIAGVFFNPKWDKEYSATFMGIEIADLFSYPIHQFVKYKKKNPAFDVLESKIEGFPNYLNKGIIIYPKKK